MASHREQVLEAVLGLVKAALPNAEVRRNRKKPGEVDPGGTVIIRDGDPGEPEVLLSPLSYTYDHEVRLDIAAYEAATRTREQVLDELFAAIGAAVDADRTLGGLCEWMELQAPSPDDAEAEGMEPIRWAELGLTCVYTISSPVA